MNTSNNLDNYFTSQKGKTGVKKRPQETNKPPDDKKSRFNGSTPPKDILNTASTNANATPNDSREFDEPPKENEKTNTSTSDTEGMETETSHSETSKLREDEAPTPGNRSNDQETENPTMEETPLILSEYPTNAEESQEIEKQDRNKPPSEEVSDETESYQERETATQNKGAETGEPQKKEQDWVYMARRMIVSLEISDPTDAQSRVELLCNSLNLFLDLARKLSGKHLRVMQYGSLEEAKEENRKQWLKKFKACSVELKEFTHGYYPFQKLRAGTYRLKLKLAVPLKKSKLMSEFITTCSEHWGNIMFPTVRDLPSQFIYNPKKLGWFLRSTRFAGHTADLQEELDRKASAFYPQLHFSLSYQTIPDPNNGIYDPETAIKAICIETNEHTFHEGWDFLQRTYNLKTTEYPNGVKMNFVGTKDHPDYKNDFTAKQNIAILMKRQRIFEENMSSVSTHVLIDIDYPYDGTRSLRHRLMDLCPKTMGPLFAKARLFHSIDRSISRTGTQTYHFTFHQSVSKEASNIVSGITEMLRDELNLEPEAYCFAHNIKDGYTWDPELRQSSNPSVDVLKYVLDLTSDLQDTKSTEGVEEEDNEFELNSKADRERDRVLGFDDSETVENLKQPKRRKPKSNLPPTSSVTVQQDEVSEVTQYSNSTKASHERKKLRVDLDEKSKRIAELEEQLASSKLASSESDHSSSESSQHTGEDSRESQSEEGGNGNPDGVGTKQVREEEQSNEVVSVHSSEEEGGSFASSKESSTTSEKDGSPSTGVRFRESRNQIKFIPRTPSKQPSPFLSSSDESESSPEEAKKTPIARKLYSGKTPPKSSQWKKPSKISASMVTRAKDQMRDSVATRGSPGESD